MLMDLDKEVKHSIPTNWKGVYYVHSSDGPSACIINQKLKGEENYYLWYCAMKVALDGGAN